MISRPTHSTTPSGKARVFARSIINEKDLLLHLNLHFGSSAVIQAVKLEELPLVAQIELMRFACHNPCNGYYLLMTQKGEFTSSNVIAVSNQSIAVMAK